MSLGDLLGFRKKTSPACVRCFFCDIQTPVEESFELEYKSADGKGTVRMCPMCAGMMEDMASKAKDLYDE